MNLALVLIVSLIEVERLRLVLLEKSRLSVINALLNVHADDLLKVSVNVVLVAKFFRYLLGIVVLINC